MTRLNVACAVVTNPTGEVAPICFVGIEIDARSCLPVDLPFSSSSFRSSVAVPPLLLRQRRSAGERFKRRIKVAERPAENWFLKRGSRIRTERNASSFSPADKGGRPRISRRSTALAFFRSVWT